MKVAIIADDLTGAMDVAGPFASRGHATWVVVSDRSCTPAQFSGADVVSINTESRHLPAEQAAARVGDAARRLVPPGTAIVIKKIDSTLRGNVAAETLALLEALGRPNAVVAPAFPGQGRTMSKGVVHVHGVPLAQTNFARDALSPPPQDPLDQVFRRHAADARVACVAPAGPFELSPAGGGRTAFVVDSGSDADLRATVRALSSKLKDCVLVGSAGLAGAVAEVCLPACAPPEQPKVGEEILVVVGSRAEQSIEQATVLAREPGTALFLAPNGLLADPAVHTVPARTLVVRTTRGTDGREGDAEQVAAAMAGQAAELLRHRPIAAVVATGGDTAVALLQALTQPALQVTGDLMPGIPCGRIRVGGRSVWLVTKAGGFGTSDTLAQVVRKLRGP